MEKGYPSKPRHGCGLPGAQLSQLKELGCGQKPHFGGKLLSYDLSEKQLAELQKEIDKLSAQ